MPRVSRGIRYLLSIRTCLPKTWAQRQSTIKELGTGNGRFRELWNTIGTRPFRRINCNPRSKKKDLSPPATYEPMFRVERIVMFFRDMENYPFLCFVCAWHNKRRCPNCILDVAWHSSVDRCLDKFLEAAFLACIMMYSPCYLHGYFHAKTRRYWLNTHHP